jgi:hypothetical protein
LIDLQVMNLLNPEIKVKDLFIDKSKIDREKARVKVKSDEIHSEGLEKLVCIGVDAKIDKDTLLYKEITDKNGVVKLKKERGQEHHLTFTKETGSESGTYLTHRVIPIIGATGVRLGEEVADVLKEFNSVETIKAVLLDNTNTNTGCHGGLVVSLENKLEKNCIPSAVHFIRMSYLLEPFSNI